MEAWNIILNIKNFKYFHLKSQKRPSKDVPDTEQILKFQDKYNLLKKYGLQRNWKNYLKEVIPLKRVLTIYQLFYCYNKFNYCNILNILTGCFFIDLLSYLMVMCSCSSHG